MPCAWLMNTSVRVLVVTVTLEYVSMPTVSDSKKSSARAEQPTAMAAAMRNNLRADIVCACQNLPMDSFTQSSSAQCRHELSRDAPESTIILLTSPPPRAFCLVPTGPSWLKLGTQL